MAHSPGSMSAPPATAAAGGKKRKNRSKSVDPVALTVKEANVEPVTEEEAPVVRLGSAVVPYMNKQRCLVFSTRGITARYRHLMEDIRRMLPHHKKDVKVRPSRTLVGSVHFCAPAARLFTEMVHFLDQIIPASTVQTSWIVNIGTIVKHVPLLRADLSSGNSSPVLTCPLPLHE